MPRSVAAHGAVGKTRINARILSRRRASGRTSPLDFRQDFVDHAVVGHHLSQGDVQTFEELDKVLTVTTQKGDPRLLAHRGKGGAADRWYLADSDLTVCLIEERLHVCEGHMRGCASHGTSLRLPVLARPVRVG